MQYILFRVTGETPFIGLHYPFRMRCKNCGNLKQFEFDPVPLPKNGKIVTFTVAYALPGDFEVPKLGLAIVELENGKKVKLLSMGPFHFKNGDPPALVLKYETEIELSDYDALKAEVDEIWKIFKHNVKKSGFSTAAIRAQRPLKGNVIKKGNGYGFVFSKQPDGRWEHMK